MSQFTSQAAAKPEIPLILASSSTYRAQLLKRLGIDFLIAAPEFNEQEGDYSAPSQIALENAIGKANSLKSKFPRHLIIGSDQTASVDTHLLTKPGTIENAHRQLQLCSGRTVLFHTAVALLNSSTEHFHTAVDSVEVEFRYLTDQEIERYINEEQPLDCCGSFKIEGLGITLFNTVKSSDPNSLVGLPLISLLKMLRSEGYTIP